MTVYQSLNFVIKLTCSGGKIFYWITEIKTLELLELQKEPDQCLLLCFNHLPCKNTLMPIIISPF